MTRLRPGSYGLRILRALMASGRPMATHELAEAIDADAQAASQVVEDLRRDGLVRTAGWVPVSWQRRPRSRRRVRSFELTDKGYRRARGPAWDEYARVVEAFRRIIAGMFGCDLDDVEVEVLFKRDPLS